jgi:hypothetical protein
MDKDAYEGTIIDPVEVEPMGSLNTASDPSKVISIPIHNWVTSAKGQDLDATDAATLEAIGDALQDGINYCNHVENAIDIFTENFGKELFTDV